MTIQKDGSGSSRIYGVDEDSNRQSTTTVGGAGGSAETFVCREGGAAGLYDTGMSGGQTTGI